jgi:hypothetical protein
MESYTYYPELSRFNCFDFLHLFDFLVQNRNTIYSRRWGVSDALLVPQLHKYHRGYTFQGGCVRVQPHKSANKVKRRVCVLPRIPINRIKG